MGTWRETLEWSAGEVGDDRATEHEHERDPVTDERAAIHRAALRPQDVEDRLADQESPTQQGDRWPALQHADEQDDARDRDLEQLEQRVGGQPKRALVGSRR